MNFGSPDQHQLDGLKVVTRRGQPALTRACQAACLHGRISEGLPERRSALGTL